MAISPKENEKKAILAILIAIIVVSAAIILFFVSIPPPPPSDHASLIPSISLDSITVAKGEQVRIEAYAIFKNGSNDIGMNVSSYVSLSITTHWDSGDDVLGTLARGKTALSTNYFILKTAATGNSTLILTFKYVDVSLITYTANKSLRITVTPPVLDSVEILPPEKMILAGKNTTFSASALLTDGTEVNASFEWNLTIALLGTLNSTEGKSVRLAISRQTATCHAAPSISAITSSLQLT
jgi:hypothetical protein